MKLRRVEKEEMKSIVAPEDESDGPPLSVHEITEAIKSTLGKEYSSITIKGELSRLTKASSGHRYFTLKDDKAAIACVMWRSRSPQGELREGDEVIATGSISVYPPRGTYQLDCRRLAPIGTGDLAAAFERLKAQLLEEGLFDQERKRTLPEFPHRIGLVTSATGAALHDITNTLERRMPMVEVLLSPSRVQGKGAAAEIERALRRLYLTDVDVIIVGRGGGSPEDLAEFNNESLARSIAEAPVPVVSAVGHEIDFSIADFVADVRAATPTAAAELVVQDRVEIVRRIGNRAGGLRSGLTRRIERLKHRLSLLSTHPSLTRPLEMVRVRSQRLDELSQRQEVTISEKVRSLKEHLSQIDLQLRALDPERVLSRGYAAVTRNGEAITSARAVEGNDQVNIRWKDGSRDAVIVKKENE